MNLLPIPRRVELGSDTVALTTPEVVFDAALPAQGYRLRIGPDRVQVEAADEPGAFYARATLEQLTRLHGGRLPTGSVEDWPDLALRGVMLDISRDKVPSMTTLFDLIDRLASWKINQVPVSYTHLTLPTILRV